MATRDDLVGYFAVILDDVLATAGVPATDAPEGLGLPLDAADRAMALVTIPETDEAATEAAYTALARYHILLRVRDKVAPRFKVAVGGDSYALPDSLAGINQLLADAYHAALFLAGPVAVAGGAGVVARGRRIGVIALGGSAAVLGGAGSIR